MIQGGPFLKNKTFLYITEFFSGMSVMAVELGASRILAPYFSSSQILWTVIIAIIMISMAIGNILGGKRADKNKNPNVLYMHLIIAGVAISSIPFLVKYIVMLSSFFVMLFGGKNFLIWASILTCSILFVFPLILLGGTTPSLAKYATTTLNDNGEIIGKLGALQTFGSILGTFIPTFLTIPSIGTKLTFIVFGGILILLGLSFFLITEKKIKPKLYILLGVFVLFSILGKNSSFAFDSKGIIYEDESVYNYLKVNEDENSIILSTHVFAGVQSIKMKDNSITGFYYDYALAASLMVNFNENKNPKSLILGMGSGTFANMLNESFPNGKITGVEIDEKIIKLAKKYFDLPNTVEIIQDDARFALKSLDKYDLILVDAYKDITVPFQMTTTEFFKEVEKHLQDDGVLVVNLNMFSNEDGNLNDYIIGSLANVYPHIYSIKTSTNEVVFATKNSNIINNFRKNRILLNDFKGKYKNSFDYIETYLKEKDGKTLMKKGYVLTDDKSPVELLGMKLLDNLIQKELEFFKDFNLKELLTNLN